MPQPAGGHSLSLPETHPSFATQHSVVMHVRVSWLQDNIGSANISSTGHSTAGGHSLPEMHLITGHANGNVVVWDPSDDCLQPVLLVGPGR